MQVGAALPVLLCCLGQALGQAVPGIEAWQAAIQAHAQAGHHALQRKSPLCIPFLGIVRPQPQFQHSCVCERFI